MVGDRGDRGDRDPDDWKKRRENDRANGFKDNRGKGGERGRGRGGRRDRDDRGPRTNDRDHSGANGAKDETVDAKPVVEKDNNKEANSSEINDKKRAREDDASDAPPAKKADVKTDA